MDPENKDKPDQNNPPLDPQTSELLKIFDILRQDLTPEQLEKLAKLASSVDLKNFKPEDAVRVVKEAGIDIEELQKKTRVNKFNSRQKKIPPNSACICGSGKKYKKCCGGVLPVEK